MPGAPPDILKNPANKVCADCGRTDPKWASVSIGIIICEVCSGIHRGIGVHITTVKSTTIDEWKPQWVKTVRGVGNAVAKAYYEHNVPEDERFKSTVELTGGDKIDSKEARKLEKWIRAKYEEKRYAPKGEEEPCKRVEKGETLDAGGGKDKKSKKDKKSSRSPSPPPVPEPEPEKKSKKDKKSKKEEPVPETPAAGKKDKKDKKSKKDKADEWNQEGGAGEDWGNYAQDGYGYDYGQDAYNYGCGGPESYGYGQDEYGYGQIASGYGQEGAAGGGQDWYGYGQDSAAGYGADAYGYGQAAGAQEAQQPGGGGAGWDPSGGEWNSYATSQAMQPYDQSGYPAYGAACDSAAGLGYSMGTGDVQGADVHERSLALGSVSKLFADPAMLGIDPSTCVVKPFGLDPYTSTIDRSALKKPRSRSQPATALGISYEGFGSCPTATASPYISSMQLPATTPAAPSMSSPSPMGWGDSNADLGGGGYGAYDNVMPAEVNTMDAFAAPDKKSKKKDKANRKSGQMDEISAWGTELPEGFGLTNMPNASAANNQTGGMQMPTPMGDQWGGNMPTADTEGANAFSFAEVDQTKVIGDLQQGWYGSDAQMESPGAMTTMDAGFTDLAAFPTVPVSKKTREGSGQSKAFHSVSEELETLRSEVKSLSLHFREAKEVLDAVKAEASGIAKWGADRPPDATELAGWVELFLATDVNHDGFIDGEEAKDILERSGLPTDDLVQVWRLSDMDLDGHLSLIEFACAMHLLSQREQGAVLPSVLPKEFVESVAASVAEHGQSRLLAEAAANWDVDASHFEAYCELFRGADLDSDGFLDGHEVGAFLDPSGLPPGDIVRVFALSDIDRDGRLSTVEFACAMHLVSLCSQGVELPATIPEEFWSRLEALKAQRQLTLQEPVPNVLPDYLPGAWRIYGSELSRYKEAFRRYDKNRDGLIEGAEARYLFDKSYLPPEELEHIWSLADVDKDGRLSLIEFACAMHLVSVRRQGGMLPPTLPLELVQSVAELLSDSGRQPAAGAAALALPAAPALLNSESSSIGMAAAQGQLASFSYTPTADVPNLGKYKRLFIEADTDHDGLLRGMEARPILEKSGLSADELMQIWTLADTDKDGSLTLVEFICAMHLVGERRRGQFLPDTLSPEFLRSVQLKAYGMGATHSTDAAAGVPALQQQGSLPRSPKSVPKSSPFEVTAQEKAKYTQLFARLDENADGFVDGMDAKTLLEKASVDSEDLMRIWALADEDQDGRLTLREFMFVMALVTARREGSPVPDGMPSVLVTSVDSGTVLSLPATPQRSLQMPISAAGGWAVSSTDLAKYQRLYKSLGSTVFGVPQPTAIAGVLRKASLPIETQTAIQELADIDGDGQVATLREFVYAMHLTTRCRAGVKLPSRLPTELASSVVF
mmetsp:Transcript_11047/g.25277  ORF Transcript_11047/g.25277 Transcript_11047/m.25277 type:complete len:1401 (+) Transcript_11047:149-4351(+)